jgi:dienelactone hydrolase
VVPLGLLAVFLGLSAASPARGAESFPRGEIVPRVVCAADASHSYALYLPSAYATDRRWPLLFLYDPRRRGAAAAEHFRDAAERYGWILASSNDTVSDDPTARNDTAVVAMWTDVNARFAVDSRRVYASGFSGGARLAVLFAQKVPGAVAGVIACGGGFPDSSPPSKGLPFAFFGTVGNVDFNYGEMRRLDRELEKLGGAHRLAVFDGPHSWCPAPVCQSAVEWMELGAMKTATRAKDPALIDRLYRERLAQAAALDAAGKSAEAYLRYSQTVEDFRGLGDVRDAEASSTRLGQSASVRKALAEQEEREEKERRAVDRLWADLNAALRSDPPPPAKQVAVTLQIARLRKDAAPERPEAERLSAARVLESIFVQTAFYLPREFAAKHDLLRAELVTRIAAELKPDRAGAAWYNLACFRATAGDRKGALESLRSAVKNGYREVEVMEADPDLASLRGEKEYRAIVDELKKPRS